MQTRNRFLETSARLSSRSSRFSSAKILAGCSTPPPPPPAIVDGETFVLDVLEFFFDERLTPGQLNNDLRNLAATVLDEAVKASNAMDLVPRPPAGAPSVGWLVGQAVQIGFRKMQRDRGIYESVRVVVKSNFRIDYDDAKFQQSKSQSYRSRSKSRWSTQKDQASDDAFVSDVLQFFFDERLSPGQLNDHLRRLAAYALSEAINASRAMDFVPRPPSLPPTVLWLVGQAVQAAFRRILQSRSIYESVRVTVKLKLKTEYELAKNDIEGALSNRRRTRSMSANNLRVSQEGLLFMQQFPPSTSGNEEISMVETAVNSTTANMTLNQNQFDALVSFCSSITSTKFLSSTLLTVMNTPINEQFTEAQRNAKIADEIRKWKLVGGEDDAESISRRGAEADLFLGGSYSSASSVYRSYAAFARAKSLPRVSRAQNPLGAVALAGAGWKLFEFAWKEAAGDITYKLARLEGAKHPDDDENQYKNKGVWQSKSIEVFSGRDKPVDNISATFVLRYKYNGYSVGTIDMDITDSNDAIGWGLDVEAKLMPDPQTYISNNGGQRMAMIEASFHYQFNRVIGNDIIHILRYKLYGDGTYDFTDQ